MGPVTFPWPKPKGPWLPLADVGSSSVAPVQKVFVPKTRVQKRRDTAARRDAVKEKAQRQASRAARRRNRS